MTTLGEHIGQVVTSETRNFVDNKFKNFSLGYFYFQVIFCPSVISCPLGPMYATAEPCLEGTQDNEEKRKSLNIFPWHRCGCHPLKR